MDEFLDRHQEGTFDSQGAFTIDPAKARQKLQTFQMPNTMDCMLKFVQAGVALGSRRIAFHVESSRVKVVLYGLVRLPELKDWPTLLENPLGFGSRAESHLAVGIVASFRLFKSLQWKQPGGGLRITDKEVTWFRIEGKNRETASLELEKRSAGTKLNWEWVENRCRYAPIPIELDGVDIRAPEWLPSPLLLDAYLPPTETSRMGIPFGFMGAIEHGESDDIWVQKGSRFNPFAKPPRAYLTKTYPGQSLSGEHIECGARICIGLPKTKKSVLTPVQDGVTLEPIEFPCHIAVRAVVANPPLDWDLSGFRAVKNGTYASYFSLFDQTLDSLFREMDANREHTPHKPRTYPRLFDRASKRVGDWICLGEGERATSYGLTYRAVNSRQGFSLHHLTLWEELGTALEDFPSDLHRITRPFREIHHPNIVPVLEVNSYKDSCFLVEPYRAGERLSTVLPSEGFELKRARQLLLSLCEIAHIAHEKSILLPLEELDGIYLADDLFLRCQTNPEQFFVGDQAMAPPSSGSARVWSPEALKDKNSKTLLSNVYNLGALGFLLFTGQAPSDDKNLITVLMNILTKDPPDPRELRPDIPEAVACLLLRCLAKEPQDRPQGMAEILEILGAT